MGTQINTTVVVPAYNEEQGLPVVLGALQKVLKDSCEIVVVNDGSRDRTAEVAGRFSCRLISHKQNRGKGAALRTGVKVAEGTKVIFIDADGTYPVEAIPRMIEALETYDMVVGSRGHQNIPFFNRIGNFAFRNALRYLYGFKARDPLTGLYGVRKEYLKRLQLGSTGFGIESEIAIKAACMGLRILDMPIEYRERIGQAKLHPLRDGYRIMKTILTFILLYNPTVTFIVPGLILVCVGLLLMGLLLSGPIRLGNIALGMHSTMIAAILALVGFQAIVFGITTKLYALAHKFTLPDFTTKIILKSLTRKIVAFLGLGSLAAGIIKGWHLVMEWSRGGFGEFVQTQEAELVSFLVVFGFQMLLSVGFILIFTEDVLKKDRFSEEEIY